MSLAHSFADSLNGQIPILWFDCPHQVIQELRELGFRDGSYRESVHDSDVTLDRAFTTKDPAHLSIWSDWLMKECCAQRNTLPTVWHPQADAEMLGQFFADRLIHLKADSTPGIIDQLEHQPFWSWNVNFIYHVACLHQWRSVTREQLLAAKQARIPKLIVTLLGATEERREFEAIAADVGQAVEVWYHAAHLELCEFPGIRFVDEVSRHTRGLTCYFHTKGVSQPKNLHWQKWRQAMMKSIISDWRINALRLWNVDVVGWNEFEDHSSGNFWIAHNDYLQRLPSMIDYMRIPNHWPNGVRHACELWVGLGKPRWYKHYGTGWNR
jgi:hypothetical protein